MFLIVVPSHNHVPHLLGVLPVLGLPGRKKQSSPSPQFQDCRCGRLQMPGVHLSASSFYSQHISSFVTSISFCSGFWPFRYLWEEGRVVVNYGSVTPESQSLENHLSKSIRSILRALAVFTCQFEVWILFHIIH